MAGIVLTGLRAALGTNGLLAGLLVALGVGAFFFDQSRVSNIRADERKNVELRNEKAVNLANRGANLSRSGSKRVLDPHSSTD